MLICNVPHIFKISAEASVLANLCKGKKKCLYANGAEEKAAKYCIFGRKWSVHRKRRIERLRSSVHACTCFVQYSISMLRHTVQCV